MTRLIPLSAALGLIASTLVPGTALAQDNGAAGLFFEARQLPVVGQSMHVDVAGDEATVTLTQVFKNDGADIGQADYRLHLPREAQLMGFGYWRGDQFLSAELQAKDDAEAAHSAAVHEGRSSAIAHTEAGMTAFSVAPVDAGALQQVELSFTLPVATDIGRSSVRLPIDRFLGQPGLHTSILAQVRSDQPLMKFGMGTEAPTVLSQEAQSLLFAHSAAHSVELWWTEDLPPLLVAADTVPLPEGDLGISLRVGLNELGDNAPTWEQVHIVLDESASMQRRNGTVQRMLDTIESAAHLPLQLHRIGDGHSARWSDVAAALDGVDCGGTAHCGVITDAQLAELENATQSSVPMVVLADAHELAHFADALPARATILQPGVDPDTRVATVADELVRPILNVGAVTACGHLVEWVGDPALRVALGGRTRASGRLPAEAAGCTVRVDLSIEGHRFTEAREATTWSSDAAPAGARVRRQVYRGTLVDMMGQWRQEPAPELRQAIIDLSLREDIPTAFTSLQVDDPELSLVAIKPGDPVLTVHPEPGLTEVVAWYPFGETRRLVRDPATGRFSDRFLVPRGWDQRAYRVEVFKHFANGGTTKEAVWYVLDETAPDVHLAQDTGTGRVRLITGAEAPEIGRVEVHTVDTVTVLETEDAGASWALPPGLSGDLVVVVRDRAGNRSTLHATLHEGVLALDTRPIERTPVPVLPTSDRALTMDNGSLRVDGGMLYMNPGNEAPYMLSGVELRSLQLTSGDDVGWGQVLGTQGGDLLMVAPGACNWGTVADLDPEGRLADHPITGVVALDEDTVLVGVNGKGLFELDVPTSTLRKSRHKIGSRFVTGMRMGPHGDVLVGTAYNGLWRLVGTGSQRSAVRSSFGPKHVAAIAPGSPHPQILSGQGRFVRLGRDRFALVDKGLNGLEVGAPDLMDAIEYGGETYVAGFDRGLLRLNRETGGLDPMPLVLDPSDKRINALAVFDGRLFLATEGGLLSVDRGFAQANLRRHLDTPVYDLAADRRGLAAASSKGLFVVSGGALDTTRVDIAPDGSVTDAALGGRFMAVAWHDGALYAGGMDGLARIDGWGPARRITVAAGFDANWVTALLSDPEQGRLLVGTYADGVWDLRSDAITPVPALVGQWVPPHGLRHTPQGVFVGGIGMDPVLHRPDHSERLPVPARDVNEALVRPDGSLLLLTSDGLATVEAPVMAIAP